MSNDSRHTSSSADSYASKNNNSNATLGFRAQKGAELLMDQPHI